MTFNERDKLAGLVSDALAPILGQSPEGPIAGDFQIADKLMPEFARAFNRGIEATSFFWIKRGGKFAPYAPPSVSNPYEEPYGEVVSDE